MVKNGKCKEQLIAEANRVRTAVVEHYHRSMHEGKVADTKEKEMNKLIDLTKTEVESSILAGLIGPKTTESLQPSTLCNKKLIWLTCCLLMTRVFKPFSS